MINQKSLFHFSTFQIEGRPSATGILEPVILIVSFVQNDIGLLLHLLFQHVF